MPPCSGGAGAVDETRTRDLNLGKVALYQLSYYRMCLRLSASAEKIIPYNPASGKYIPQKNWSG